MRQGTRKTRQPSSPSFKFAPFSVAGKSLLTGCVTSEASIWSYIRCTCLHAASLLEANRVRWCGYEAAHL
eukprot:768777-Hanusia_phi.AAC.2